MLYEDLIINLKNLSRSRPQLSPEEYRQKAEYLVKCAKPYGLAEVFQSILFGYSDSPNIKKAYKIHGRDIFPIRNQEEAECAFNYLRQYRDRLSYTTYTKLAKKLLTKHHTGVCNLSQDKLDYLYKLAGFGISPKETILAGLNSRKLILEKRGKKHYAEAVSKLIEDVSSLPLDDLYVSKYIDGVAAIISKIDRETKLARYYNRGVTPPEEFLFSTTISDLKQFDNEIIENVKTGKVYHTSDLDKIDVKLLRHFLGDKDFFIDGYLIDRDYFREWVKQASDEEAKLLDRIFEWSGVKPIGKRIK